MPGSVNAAAPATVMPYTLASAFQQVREWVIVQNRYRNGETQEAALFSTSRKRWTQTRLLDATALAALRAYFLARGGSREEFYFYDVYETSPQFSYDATGAASTGRYAVRFDGEFQQTLSLARNQAQLALVEVS